MHLRLLVLFSSLVVIGSYLPHRTFKTPFFQNIQTYAILGKFTTIIEKNKIKHFKLNEQFGYIESRFNGLLYVCLSLNIIKI